MALFIMSTLILCYIVGSLMGNTRMVTAAIGRNGKAVKVIGITFYEEKCFIAYKEDFKGEIVKLLPPIHFHRQYGKVIKVRG